MKRVIMNPGFLICILVSVAGGDSGQGTKPDLILEGPERVVKGFPAILRIACHGPQRVPIMTVLDETAEVRIDLISSEKETGYTISSTKGRTMTVTGPDGEHMDDHAIRMFQTTVAASETRTMLLDLASLRPEIGVGTVLQDVPAGVYTVTVYFRSSELTSNPLDIQIEDPSASEAKFLEELRTRAGKPTGTSVNWARILRHRIHIPSQNLSQLRDAAREQVSFYVVLSGSIPLPDGSRWVGLEELNSLSVPAYLKAEKACFLLKSRREPLESEKADLLERNPGLAWRFEDTRVNEFDFLRERERLMHRRNTSR